MLRFTTTALLAVCTLVGSLVCARAENCSPAREEQLLTTVFYREAEITPADHASVLAIILTALKEGSRGSTLCAVMTYGNFVVHRLDRKRRLEPAKWAASQNDARKFLGEYHSQGTVTSEASVFDRLRGLDSFHAKSFRGAYASACTVVVGDNCFYKAGTTRRHPHGGHTRRRHHK